MYDKGIGGLAVGGTTPSIGKGLVCVAKGIYYAAVGVIGAVSGYVYKMSKGGKQRIRDTGLAGVSDEVIADRLKDPRTSKSEKQKLKKEQKARGDRNKQKRGRKK